MADKELILGLRQGDTKAFTVLYRKYWAKVYNFSRVYLSSVDDAEDVVQAVFLKLWESREFIRENDKLDGFLFIITRNLIFNQFRRSFNENAYRETVLSVIDSHLTNDVEEQIFVTDLKAYVDLLIKELSPRQQEIYRLSRMEYLTYREIAVRLSISEKTVERHINDALKILRKNLLIYSIFLSI